MWTFFTGIGGKLAAAAAALLAALGALALARRGGVQAQQAADLKQEVCDVQKANAARAAVDAAGSDRVASELREDWTRR